MKKFWIAVIISENGKHYSYMITATEQSNIVCKLKINNIVSANIYPTKKEASAIVTYWNECFKHNGTYLFDETF